MELLSWVLFGFVVGLIARAVMPGRDPLGLIATVVLGIAGALLGGWTGQFLGFYRTGENVGMIGATVGAVLVLAVYNAISRRQGAQRRAQLGEAEKKRDRAA